jgi:hypothetical protein
MMNALYAECRYTECRYAECSYAEYRGTTPKTCLWNLPQDTLVPVDTILRLGSSEDDEWTELPQKLRAECYKAFYDRNLQVFGKCYRGGPWQAFSAWGLYLKTYYGRNLWIP